MRGVSFMFRDYFWQRRFDEVFLNDTNRKHAKVDRIFNEEYASSKVAPLTATAIIQASMSSREYKTSLVVAKLHHRVRRLGIQGRRQRSARFQGMVCVEEHAAFSSYEFPPYYHHDRTDVVSYFACDSIRAALALHLRAQAHTDRKRNSLAYTNPVNIANRHHLTACAKWFIKLQTVLLVYMWGFRSEA